MSGERLSNRPAGAAESDLDTLNDWTVMNIANTEKFAPEDRQNAEAEIARRESEGTYDPESASHDVRHDLLFNGYGVEDGKVLYPKPEYKAWLQSDRSEPMPTGINKETIQDRLDAEKVGSAALDAYAEYENKLSMREKIAHPERTLSESDKVSMERKAEEKARDIELDERRKLKEINKYDSSYSNPEKEAASQARANLPIIEEQPVTSERIREVESLDSKAEKMYNVYSEHFSENAPKWLAYGVSSAIERGTFNSLPIDSLVASGFWSREQDKIHDKLDPEDVVSAETIDAESNLKVRIARNLIGERSSELSEEEVKHAKLKGMINSIYSGARTDERSRKVIYAIPPEKGSEVREFMDQTGIDFEQFGKNARARTLSYQGFANIIEAIKNNNNETERGFKALDWYFDNFGYGEQDKNGQEGKIDAFLGALGDYEAVADDAWKIKYNEYLGTRKEISNFYESQKSKDFAPGFAPENIQEDAYEELQADLSAVQEYRILPLTSFWSGGGRGGRRKSGEYLDEEEKESKSYVDKSKLRAILEKFTEYQRFDKDTKIHKAYWVDNNTHRETHYAVIDYVREGQKVAIIAPYEAMSSDASYDIIGEDWEEVFTSANQSKISIRNKENVRAHNHRANMKESRDGIANMWFNHEKHVDKVLRSQ